MSKCNENIISSVRQHLDLSLSLSCAPRSLRSTPAIQRPLRSTLHSSQPSKASGRAREHEHHRRLATPTSSSHPGLLHGATGIDAVRRSSIRQLLPRRRLLPRVGPAPRQILPHRRPSHPWPAPRGIPSMEIWAPVKQMKARRRQCDWLINTGELLVGSSVVRSGHRYTPAAPPRLSPPSLRCLSAPHLRRHRRRPSHRFTDATAFRSHDRFWRHISARDQRRRRSSVQRCRGSTIKPGSTSPRRPFARRRQGRRQVGAGGFL
jgi:hypothetical protein